MSIEVDRDSEEISLQLDSVIPEVTVTVSATVDELSLTCASEETAISVTLVSGDMVDVEYPTYPGPYEATPRVAAQSLKTSGQAMTDDVTIKAIPIYEVSNAYGTTVNIGG